MRIRRLLLVTPVFLALAAMLVLCTGADTRSAKSDLTIFVGGDLLHKGGIVFVHPIPVSPERWQTIAAEENRSLPPPEGLARIDETGKRMTTTITGQATFIQFLYPTGKRQYAFRFRPVPETDAQTSANFGTRLLTIGGVDADTGLGEDMKFGFIGLHDSGVQILEVVRQGIGPQAARSLAAAIEHPQPEPEEAPRCTTRSAISVCGYDEAQWRRIAARWEMQRRKNEWEQRRFTALNACYRGAERNGRTGGHCDLKSEDGVDPIIYEYRDKTP